jgi:hypothetical protein
MKHNMVTNSSVLQEIKKCRHFVLNLGMASTADKGGNRVLSDKDRFAHAYNTQYKATIYAQGYIGDIRFYTDHYILEPVIAVYFGDEYSEFIFSVNYDIIKEKGIDFYLGSILKEVETKYAEKMKEIKEHKEEPKKDGNPDIVGMNPGSVTQADIKAYMDKQNAERYKNNKQI